jgi:hypothetical protein
MPRQAKATSTTRSTSKTPKATPKPINKKAKSPAKTKAAPAKKPAVAKKVAAKPSKNSSAPSDKSLDLALLLDCTASMGSWIERSKKTLKEIIDNTVRSCDGKLSVMVSFVGYRDFCDSKRFDIMDFTNDIEKIKNFISTVTATGGGDGPEDVTGGLDKCLKLKWRPGSSK